MSQSGVPVEVEAQAELPQVELPTRYILYRKTDMGCRVPFRSFLLCVRSAESDVNDFS